MTVRCFGDSVTYGHGLEDCFNPIDNTPGKQPSKFAWPAKLGSDYINYAVPGCSNKHIARRVADTTFEQNDICVVMWTYLDRWSVLDWDDGNTIRIGPWMTTKKHMQGYQYYKHIYREFDSWYSNLVMIDWCNKLLDSRGVRHYNLWNNGGYQHTLKKMESYTPWFDINFEDITSIIKRSDYNKALDGLHPGPSWQIAVAEKIAEIIND